MDIAKEENDAPSERKRCILFCRGATEEGIAQQAADLHEYAKANHFEVIECTVMSAVCLSISVATGQLNS